MIGGTGPTTMALVAEYADWWNVPMHQTDRLEPARPPAGGARVSVQLLVTLVTDERRRDEVECRWPERRFGWHAGPRAPGGQCRPSCWPGWRRSADEGVERVYTWFTDFATPETLEVFGPEVIGPLA